MLRKRALHLNHATAVREVRPEPRGRLGPAQPCEDKRLGQREEAALIRRARPAQNLCERLELGDGERLERKTPSCYRRVLALRASPPARSVEGGRLESVVLARVEQNQAKNAEASLDRPRAQRLAKTAAEGLYTADVTEASFTPENSAFSAATWPL